MRGAYVVSTCGQEPFVYPVMAKIAFLGNIVAGIKGDSVIRAGGDARLTSHTSLRIQNNNPVVSF